MAATETAAVKNLKAALLAMREELQAMGPRPDPQKARALAVAITNAETALLWLWWAESEEGPRIVVPGATS